MSSGGGLGAFFQALVAVLPAELPDKSMFATVALVAHHRKPRSVFAGAVCAFALHAVLAASVGGVIARLPERVVAMGAAAAFALGAAAMVRAARSAARSETTEPANERASEATTDPATGESPRSRWATGAFASSFAVLGLAEFGDLTQLTIAGISARTGSPAWVGLGGWLALCCVAAVAAAGGQALARRLPVRMLQFGAAGVFALLAVISLVAVVQG